MLVTDIRKAVWENRRNWREPKKVRMSPEGFEELLEECRDVLCYEDKGRPAYRIDGIDIELKRDLPEGVKFVLDYVDPDRIAVDAEDVLNVEFGGNTYLRLDIVADLLARNYVQWPNRSEDCDDYGVLKQMWEYILEKHLVKK